MSLLFSKYHCYLGICRCCLVNVIVIYHSRETRLGWIDSCCHGDDL